MGLLTIGGFARASRLSPKALRLYDELGLLAPASVDPVSGYRFYSPDQLERARLIAWLRRLLAVGSALPSRPDGDLADLDVFGLLDGERDDLAVQATHRTPPTLI